MGTPGHSHGRQSTTASSARRWDRAFELVLRFELDDLIEPLIEAAYGPLVRSGHVGTLSAFAEAVTTGKTFPPPGIDLISAEVALRDGSSRLAADLGIRVRNQLKDSHPLASKASKIVAQAAFTEGDLPRAVAAYDHAYSSARDERDKVDALYGWSMASVQGEIDASDRVLSELREHRHKSPLQLVRFGTADLARWSIRERGRPSSTASPTRSPSAPTTGAHSSTPNQARPKSTPLTSTSRGHTP